MNTSTQPYVKSIEIVFEDEFLVEVNKTNNFIIHESHYARNIRETTLIKFLERDFLYKRN